MFSTASTSIVGRLALLVVVTAVFASSSVQAWTSSNGAPTPTRKPTATTFTNHNRQNKVGSSSSSPQNPPSPQPLGSPTSVHTPASTSTANHLFPNNAAATFASSSSPSRRQRGRSDSRLSGSLASCDTLPAFRTSHGLLSPETVLRLQESSDDGSMEDNVAVQRFLHQYRTDGPLSCVSMLSDPEVLPHLTAAMRDIL